ncbi:MAG TPA: ferritin-like domain-containing protein [Blastocatellia bacterium]|nr:ferritin-like domain-containing protein [Blastocatellia bacterium]
MTRTETSPAQIIDIEDLGFDRGAHLLIKKALAEVPVGGKVGVRGRAPDLAVHLRGWCRSQGHEIIWPENGLMNHDVQSTGDSPFVAWIVHGASVMGRWRHAETAGATDPRQQGAVVDRPNAKWGLAARGSQVEAGGPEFHFNLDSKEKVWADNVPRLYLQAAAAQWNPAAAIDWDAEFELPPEIETAVVQVMTYLIENETAALLVPAKFLAQVHPHFREVMQLLAIQVADEARHIEVFTHRATLKNKGALGLSTVSGQQSLKTLLDEPDFTLASLLLSVLGEGTFLNLLWFLEQYAPDPVTRQVAKLAAQDEARHVAFGMGHLQYMIALDPHIRSRLSAAINRRHDALAQTSGLNEEVFDSLTLLVAGAWTPHAIARGFEMVQQLQQEMQNDRTGRLEKLGFNREEASALSALHTRNFM